VIAEKKGELDGTTLRRIAIIYNVSRGIRAKEENRDIHADSLAQLLNAALPWPSDIVERAKKCLEIAEKAKELRHTSTLQASAVTKFSWFAQPAGWTVYDRFVSRAMGIESQRTGDRMVDFYQELENRGFTEIADKVQTALDEVYMMDLQGTRVLDKLMMLNGAAKSERAWADNVRSVCHGFLNLLPDDWRQSVEEVAERVVTRVDTSSFLNG